MTLAWLNSLGGWESFEFTARRTFGIEVIDTQIRNRSVFQSWPVNFTDHDLENIRIETRDAVTVRSGQLTEGELNAIKEIRRAITVYDLDNDVEVQVDKSSFDYFTDREKRRTIEFRINYPKTYVQVG